MGALRDWSELDRTIDQAAAPTLQSQIVDLTTDVEVSEEIKAMDTAEIGREISQLKAAWLTNSGAARIVRRSRIRAQNFGINRLKQLKTEFRRRTNQQSYAVTVEIRFSPIYKVIHVDASTQEEAERSAVEGQLRTALEDAMLAGVEATVKTVSTKEQ